MPSVSIVDVTTVYWLSTTEWAFLSSENPINEHSIPLLQQGVECNFVDSTPWVILSLIESNIKWKIETVGTPFKMIALTYIVELLLAILI